MNVLQVQGVSKSFGVATVLSQVSFFLQEGEKVGLVGANGVGKSTLLKIISRQEEADSGEIIFAKGATCGYLAQEGAFAEGSTVLQEMLAVFTDLSQAWRQMQALEKKMAMPDVYESQERLAGVMEEYSTIRAEYERRNGYAIESKIRSICAGLGFKIDDLGKKISEFSGGQKTRLALAKLLLQEPSLLLLDEPTNHLDLQACEWLEDYLRGYPGTVLVVSHDRYFLDKVVGRIAELSRGQLRSYRGNYTEFLQQKEKEKAILAKNFSLYQAKVKKLEEYIRRNRAGINAKQAQGRESLLEKLKPIERPPEEDTIRFTFRNGKQTGEKVLELKEIGKSFGEKVLFSGVNLLVRRGERLGIIGPNGAGKSTLLKIMAGDLEPSQGEIIYGKNVQISYYDQEQRNLDSSCTVIEEIRNTRPMTEEEARNFLARFLFVEDDVFKSIGVLSGGEKSRVLLAKLLLLEGNLLLLDEPTNHLDIQGKEVLESALDEYEGTVILISHDRYFLDRTVGRILEMEPGKVTEYHGDYTYYRWKKEQQAQTAKGESKEPKKRTIVSLPKTVKRKENNPDTTEIMERIEAIEQEMSDISQALADTETYGQPEVVKELSERYEVLSGELNSLYALWEKIL